jgi:hypothetical protein
VDESDIVEVDNGVGTHMAVDNADGTYSLTTNKFTVSAYYLFHVKLNFGIWNSVTVSGSPFRIFISAAELDLVKTTAQGSGVIGGKISPTVPYRFTITPHDKYGNRYAPTVSYSQVPARFEVSLAGRHLSSTSLVLGTVQEVCTAVQSGGTLRSTDCSAAPGSITDF